MTADHAAIRARLIQDLWKNVELYYSGRYSDHQDLDAEVTADNLLRDSCVAEFIAQVEALRAVIDALPHEPGCLTSSEPVVGVQFCSCAKSRVPSEVTPEPPKLDPKPWVDHQSEQRLAVRHCMHDHFAPRPEYEQDRAKYEASL